MTLINNYDRDKARAYSKAWASSIINNPDVYYLDIETNTLPKDDNDAVDIIQIGIIDNYENVIFDSLLKCDNPISPLASKVHGIEWHHSRSSVFNFHYILPFLDLVFKEKHVVCYNAGFDINQIKLNYLSLRHKPPNILYDCAMLYYAQYCGMWSNRKNSWKWQKLPNFSDGKAHTSVSDSISTKRLVEFMANDKPMETDIDLNF